MTRKEAEMKQKEWREMLEFFLERKFQDETKRKKVLDKVLSLVEKDEQMRDVSFPTLVDVAEAMERRGM